MENKADIISIASNKLTEYLESNKCRKTPERYEILQTICQIKGLFSIETLSDEMTAKAKFQVSRATLFNTLELFTKANLVVKHTLIRAALYECSIDPQPTVCLVCQKCDSVTKVDNEEMQTWLKSLKVRQFAIHQPVLYLHGMCKKCAAAKNKKTSNKKK